MIVPFIATYARQLGFSPVNIGLMMSMTSLVGLIVKPMVGFVSDRSVSCEFIPIDQAAQYIRSR